MVRRLAAFAMLGGFCGIGIPSPAVAQVEWPGRPVRLIVPYATGGNVDLLGRLISPKLSEALGQPVVVDNRPGAGAMLGAGEAARARPDGHTLLIGDIATHAINPALNDKLTYDPAKDFSPVIRLTSVSLLMVVNPKHEARSVAELIAFAKRNPGQLNYASAGNGSAQQLAFEYFKSLAGIDAVHVAYKGSAPAISDLLGGHISVMIDGTAVPHVRDGALRALAATGPNRPVALPAVPTMAEAGVPGYAFASWHGLFLPAGTPPTIVNRVNVEVNKIIADPAIRERMASLNIDLQGGSPEEFAAFIQGEARKIRDLVRAAGIKAD